MLRIACPAVLLVASSALASPATADEPPPPPPSAAFVEHGFVGGGAAWSVGKFFQQALAVEGGVRVADLPLWVHGLAAFGNGGDFEGGGTAWRTVAGLELRQCSGAGGACLVLGIDLGFQSERWSSGNPGEMDELHRGFFGASRVGIDTGGRHIRFRADVEITQFDDHSNVVITTWDLGFATSVGVAYRL
jgi:hypothetical protein